MQNSISRITCAFILFSLLWITSERVSAAVEIQWYLAASLTKPAREVVHLFNQREKSCAVIPIIGGSGQLLSKIMLARTGDLYTPASVEFLDKTRAAGAVTEFHLLLTQTPVFGLSKSGAKKISSFEDLTLKNIKIALGNPKTMALGNSYLKIEKSMPQETARQIRDNLRVEAVNVNQIVSYLKLDVIDAGTIFDTVAKVHRIPYVLIPKKYNIETGAYLIRLVYSKAPNRPCLNRFVHFIFDQTDIFSKYGYQLRSINDEDL